MTELSYIERNRGFITYSKLKAFRFCQQLYKQKYMDEIVLEEEDNDALIFGQAFDTLVQGEDKFAEKFVAVAKRTDKAREENPGKVLITPAQLDTLNRCYDESKRQPLYRPDGDKQVEIIIPYKGFQLKATMDKLFLKEKEIRDVKTAASIQGLGKIFQDRSTLQSYIDQLTFYQFCVQMKHDVLCDGVLEVFTKETPVRSQMFKASAQTLLDNRGVLLGEIDKMIETINFGIFESSERSKCLECEAYGVCPFTIQQEFIQL